MNIRLFNKISEEVFGGSRYDDVVEKYGLRVVEKYMEFGEEGDLFIRNFNIIRYERKRNDD